MQHYHTRANLQSRLGGARALCYLERSSLAADLCSCGNEFLQVPVQRCTVRVYEGKPSPSKQKSKSQAEGEGFGVGAVGH